MDQHTYTLVINGASFYRGRVHDETKTQIIIPSTISVPKGTPAPDIKILEQEVSVRNLGDLSRIIGFEFQPEEGDWEEMTWVEEGS